MVGCEGRHRVIFAVSKKLGLVRWVAVDSLQLRSDNGGSMKKTKKANSQSRGTPGDSSGRARYFGGWSMLLAGFLAGLVAGYFLHAVDLLSIAKRAQKSLFEKEITLESIVVDEPENMAERNFAQACRNGIIPACYNWGFLKKQKGKMEETRFLYKYACGKSYQLACNAYDVL
ncbi:MAG: hypothetical protein KDD35_07000 [Bdellovibrionales bacterium]|nr:hypothetical protein [Bdellovibrionales bacterium]